MPAWVSDPLARQAGRIFGCALLLCAASGVARAEDGIFSRLTGTYGSPDDPSQACATNPEHVTFSADGSRLLIDFGTPVLDYLGQDRTHAGYDVLAQDAAGVTVLLDGEERTTDAGEPVVWIMRPTTAPDGYCWGRTDWPVMRCPHRMVRCTVEPLLG